MKTGKASPYYGRLNTRDLPNEVKVIWRSRNDELPDLPTTGTLAVLEQTDQDLDDKVDFVRRLVAITPLTDREEQAIAMHVLEDYTLDEVGKSMDVTRERARQIINKGLRRLLAYQRKLTDNRMESRKWWSIALSTDQKM